MIDFHSHILPDVDDGSCSVNESVNMLKTASSQGVKYIVATPHFYPNKEDPSAFSVRRMRAQKEIQKAVSGESDIPRIFLGAEVQYYDGLSHIESLDSLKIQGTNVLLLEMPFSKWNERILRNVWDLQNDYGCQVIMAHIERYLKFQDKVRIWDQLAELNVLIQANASFFTSFGQKHKALKLLNDGKIHLLGSDCHGEHRRPPNMDAAFKVISSRYGTAPIKKMDRLGKRLLRIEE